MKYILKTTADTRALAGELVKNMRPNLIIALSGPIGAGKTTLVKEFAAACGVTATVVSPTYTLLQPYELPQSIRGVSRIIHVDAYRLKKANDLRDIGFNDFATDPSAVIIIEWAENVSAILKGHDVLRITFSMVGKKRSCTTHELI